MDRQRFGGWGIHLSEGAFAEALAGAGVSDWTIIGSAVTWALPRAPEEFRQASPEVFQAQWRDFRAAVPTVRLRVAETHGLNPAWLASMLGQTASSVYFVREILAASISAEWPLRIGFLDENSRRAFEKQFSASSMRKLTDMMQVTPGRSRCEILLLPFNLRAAAAQLLSTQFRPECDCLIVVGTADVEDERIGPLMSVLRSEARTAGVAVANVNAGKRDAWFKALIAHLSHDEPIDLALAKAGKNVEAPAPLLVCSDALADTARLSVFVRRLGECVAQLPDEVALEPSPFVHRQLFDSTSYPVMRDFGLHVAFRAPSYDYKNESGDASAVVDFRDLCERSLGEQLLLRPAVLSDTIPAFSAKGAEEIAGPLARYVQARFHEGAGGIASRIQPSADYIVGIRIAAPEGDWIVAPGIFDESHLPKSERGHDLTIAFVELRDGSRSPLTAPQQQIVHLPQFGPSDTAHFAVRTANTGAFVARVIVLHEGRVLQTWTLRAPLGQPQSEVVFAEENIIKADFDGLEGRRPFDAAIVVNDHEDGTPGLTVSTPAHIAFLEPVGFRQTVDEISKLITGMTELAETDFTLDDPDLRKLLIDLAGHGKLLWDLCTESAPSALQSASRVQVVEARKGAFLPAEFFYSSYAPDSGARICPHGRDALATLSFTACPNATDRAYVCPAVFWGFNRVVERRAYQQRDVTFEYQVSEPSGYRRRIDPFERALLGASAKIAARDIDDEVLPAMKSVARNGVDQAPDWKAWMAAIKSSPTLLVLMPHTDEANGFARLEIGKEALMVTKIEEDFVRPHAHEPGPVVLLLGCSTELTTIPLQSFVGQFQRKGAALVLGTLSTIRGRHATRFVKQFVASLAEWCGKRDATVGDALLAVKRKMIASGDPFALTLVAYGDADWRL